MTRKREIKLSQIPSIYTQLMRTQKSHRAHTEQGKKNKEMHKVIKYGA